MIFGHKSDIEKLLPYVSEDLQKALQYLAATDFSKVADGRYELDGDKMYANVETYTTAGRSTKKPEAHNKYIDVQYLGKGTEKIYFAPRTADVKVVEDYAQERDLLFFENIEEKDAAILNAGCFAVLFPWELHRPGCIAETEPSEVQKIVVKIAVK